MTDALDPSRGDFERWLGEAGSERHELLAPLVPVLERCPAMPPDGKERIWPFHALLLSVGDGVMPIDRDGLPTRRALERFCRELRVQPGPLGPLALFRAARDFGLIRRYGRTVELSPGALEEIRKPDELFEYFFFRLGIDRELLATVSEFVMAAALQGDLDGDRALGSRYDSALVAALADGSSDEAVIDRARREMPELVTALLTALGCLEKGALTDAGRRAAIFSIRFAAMSPYGPRHVYKLRADIRPLRPVDRAFLPREPDWRPLQSALPLDQCSGFMWMGKTGAIHSYKHKVTRRPLFLDDEGRAYRSYRAGAAPMPLDEALDHVFEDIELFGYTRAMEEIDPPRAEDF